MSSSYWIMNIIFQIFQFCHENTLSSDNLINILYISLNATQQLQGVSRARTFEIWGISNNIISTNGVNTIRRQNKSM